MGKPRDYPNCVGLYGEMLMVGREEIPALLGQRPGSRGELIVGRIHPDDVAPTGVACSEDALARG